MIRGIERVTGERFDGQQWHTESEPLVHGDCGMDVVDLPVHHGVEFPSMAYPGEGCER